MSIFRMQEFKWVSDDLVQHWHAVQAEPASRDGGGPNESGWTPKRALDTKVVVVLFEGNVSDLQSRNTFNQSMILYRSSGVLGISDKVFSQDNRPDLMKSKADVIINCIVADKHQYAKNSSCVIIVHANIPQLLSTKQTSLIRKTRLCVIENTSPIAHCWNTVITAEEII